ncbi:hypothetical protein [Actinoplanes teichomyceticus]|uniref:Luciferase-like monooxygenase n=1 Tax=Actinoplanes teichomyceticus TaxID=1867 RepID=A0A561VIU1_ACTTI|nr:hypothetical protein [Actinoplanes teichomyceticus]TWG11532.1 hypothetical protein FHX34_106262 [Actinoplanes teichomyceticus]
MSAPSSPALGRVGVGNMRLRSAARPQIRAAVAERDGLARGAIWLPGLDGAGAPVPGRSDRLIDALVAHGDVDGLARRVREHLDAGVDHVAPHVFTDPGSTELPLAQWREPAATLVH